MKIAKVICVKHIHYGWTHKGTNLSDPDDICECSGRDDKYCLEEENCRPIKVTYQFIKRIPT